MKHHLPLAILALVLAALPARAGQLVVVEARGVALKPGSMLDDSKPLQLKQGQHVTLISPSGATIALDGPYDKAPASEKQGVSLGTKLAALTTESNARTGEVGTTRGVAPLAKLPDPWLIDVGHAGNACLLEGQTPVFWRAQANDSAMFVVMPDDRSWKVLTTWPAHMDRLSVTTNVPMRGGATYFVSFNGTEYAIAVNTVPATLPNDAVRAAWMAEKGCEAQAEVLARAQR